MEKVLLKELVRIDIIWKGEKMTDRDIGRNQKKNLKLVLVCGEARP